MNTRSKSTGPRSAKGAGKKAKTAKNASSKTQQKATARGEPAMPMLVSNNPFDALSSQDGDSTSDMSVAPDGPTETSSQLVGPDDSASQVGHGGPLTHDEDATPKATRYLVLEQHTGRLIPANGPVTHAQADVPRKTADRRPRGRALDLSGDKENQDPRPGPRPGRSLTVRGREGLRPNATTPHADPASAPTRLTLVPMGDRQSTPPVLTFVGPVRQPIFDTAPYTAGRAGSDDDLSDPPRDPTPKPSQPAAQKHLTASEIRQGHMPVGAPMLMSRQVIPAKRGPPLDRSPNGRQIERDSLVPHKKPRLHATRPLQDVPEFSLDSPMDVDDDPAQPASPHASALHALTEAIATGSHTGPASDGSLTPTPGMQHFAHATTTPNGPDAPQENLTEAGRADTPIPGSPSDPHLPGVMPASLEDYVASDTATIGTAHEPASAVTPTPPSNFPDTHGGGPGWQLANQTKASLAGWLGIEGGKVLAVPFGQGANDHKISDKLFSTVAHIQQATARFLGVPTVHVAPPIAEKPVADVNQAPYTFLIHGISTGRATQLLQQKCLSTPNVTVLFFPFGFSLPALFVNFGHIVDCGSDMVRNMAIATMTRGPNFAAMIELLRETPGLPATMDFAALAQRLINTVRITRSERFGRGAVLTPVYNLFMSTSLMNADTWPRWHRLLNSFQWSDVFLAEVAVRNDVECEGCHGRDHYQHACPFMQIPGFFGTMPQAKRCPQTSTNQQRASSSKAGDPTTQPAHQGAKGPRTGRVFTRQPTTTPKA